MPAKCMQSDEFVKTKSDEETNAADCQELVPHKDSSLSRFA